jgi:hypothetical protein
MGVAKLWKKGRGKLGPLLPLHGSWVAEAETAMGRVTCRRTLEPILGGHYLKLSARWDYGEGGEQKAYDELAVIGVGDDGQVCFWSFTSDGKRSQGVLADVTELHPEAVGFEADMPAGRARMAYWPDPEGGFRWVVEAKKKKGWSRMVEHHYLPAANA